MDSTSIYSRLESALRYHELLEKLVSTKEKLIVDEQLVYEKNARLYVESEEKYKKLIQGFEQKYSGVSFVEHSQEDLIDFLYLFS